MGFSADASSGDATAIGANSTASAGGATALGVDATAAALLLDRAWL